MRRAAAFVRYDTGKGWSGPIAADRRRQWRSSPASSFIGIDYDNWRVAAVLAKTAGEARIGFADGEEGACPPVPRAWAIARSRAAPFRRCVRAT